jgi:hypothetical protein
LPSAEGWVFEKVTLLSGWDSSTGRFVDRSTKKMKGQVRWSFSPSSQNGGDTTVTFFFPTPQKQASPSPPSQGKGGQVVGEGDALTLYAYEMDHSSNEDEGYVEKKFYLSFDRLKNPRPDNISYICFVRYRLGKDWEIGEVPFWVSLLEWPDRGSCILLFR